MDTQEPPSFGVLLRRYRAAAGLTQEELAERTGLSVRGISDLERGTRTQPRLATIHRLAGALQLSGDDRATFEQTGLMASRFLAANDVLSAGTFLGALPTGQLVAREEERERFRAALDAVMDGAGHVLLLGGESGVGKTRLLQELMVDARDRDYAVATARCYASDQESPYYPFLEALSALSTSKPARSLVEAQRSWKQVRRLVGEGIADGGVVGPNVVRQQQLFLAVSNLLQTVAGSAPVVILIDDLQWADANSLRLLQYLAHATRDSRILIAAAFRVAHLTEEHPELSQAIQTLSRERLAERITIRRLSLEETTQLVAGIMGQPQVSEEFAHFVYRRTKGIPRLIEQLVRSLGGRLELQGEIGAGAMGRVFRAYDRERAELVAAKLVLARTEIDLDTLLRFQQEGAVLARLDHPHIVVVHDTFAEEHATCIIMELIEGNSLGRLLQAGPLPLGRAKRIALQVADALAYAHAQSIVHRDIKPDNIMVLPDDQVKVTDFGIARLLQPDTSLQTIATTGMRLGTPLYMAPEQIEGKKVDGRSDLYALGSMLYHMVTGHPPFEGSDALTIAVKHLQEQPVPPSSLDPSIPAEWDAVILKAMAKDPASRFQRVEEIREAMEALPEERSKVQVPAAGEDSGTASTPARQDARTRRRTTGFLSARRLAGAVGVAGVCAAMISWLLLLSPWPTVHARVSSGRPTAVWGVKLPRSFHFKTPIILGSPVHGSLYVGDPIHLGIIRLSARTGQLLAAWGSKGTKPGQFRGFNDMATDSHGDVYVVDHVNDQVTEFTADGTFIRAFGHKGFSFGALYSPDALAVDAHDNIIIADSYNDRIEEFSSTGKSLAVWSSRGSGRNQVFGPNAIRVDARDDIWVTEHANLRIHEFSATGKTLAIFSRPGKGPGELTDPQALAFDTSGNVYVLDEELERIQKFSPKGRLLAVWNKRNHPEFNDLGNISIDGQDRVYITDPGNGRLHILSTGGKLLADWNVLALVHQQFRQPAYLAVDRRGESFVTDTGRDAVEEISPAGSLLLAWGKRGSGPGEFRSPAGIALDARGNVYVADTGNGRIQEFTPAGTLIGEWSTRTARTGLHAHPTGLAIDRHGDIFVTDPASNLVQEFSPVHRLQVEWGRTDPAHKLYWLTRPVGVAVDRKGNVYVADSGNSRVVEFSLTAPYFSTGRPLKQWGGTHGSRPGQFDQLAGVAVDARGDVYVTDAAASRIQVLAPGGKLIAMWGTHGSDPGRFESPTGVAIDDAGNVYVVDSGNSRIQKFRPIN